MRYDNIIKMVENMNIDDILDKTEGNETDIKFDRFLKEDQNEDNDLDDSSADDEFYIPGLSLFSIEQLVDSISRSEKARYKFMSVIDPSEQLEKYKNNLIITLNSPNDFDVYKISSNIKIPFSTIVHNDNNYSLYGKLIRGSNSIKGIMLSILHYTQYEKKDDFLSYIQQPELDIYFLLAENKIIVSYLKNGFVLSYYEIPTTDHLDCYIPPPLPLNNIEGLENKYGKYLLENIISKSTYELAESVINSSISDCYSIKSRPTYPILATCIRDYITDRVTTSKSILNAIKLSRDIYYNENIEDI